jgi:hypothetical protein
MGRRSSYPGNYMPAANVHQTRSAWSQPAGKVIRFWKAMGDLLTGVFYGTKHCTNFL